MHNKNQPTGMGLDCQGNEEASSYDCAVTYLNRATSH